MLSVNDPHRYTSLWADQYGPLVKLRILFFHVSFSSVTVERCARRFRSFVKSNTGITVPKLFWYYGTKALSLQAVKVIWVSPMGQWKALRSFGNCWSKSLANAPGSELGIDISASKV